jgi:hypothetical protein
LYICPNFDNTGIHTLLPRVLAFGLDELHLKEKKNGPTAWVNVDRIWEIGKDIPVNVFLLIKESFHVTSDSLIGLLLELAGHTR